MRLDLQSIAISNFKSFREAKIDFAAAGPGLHFIYGHNEVNKRLGSNGAGKSSIWDAVTWNLFGRTVGGLRNPDVVSWGKKQAEVLTTWKIGKDNYGIYRSINPNNLILNGEPVGQERIDKLLRINFDLFVNSILMGQGRPLFFDMPPRDKMELLSSTLQLDKWEERSAHASGQVKDYELSLAEMDAEIRTRTDVLAGMDSRIADLDRRSRIWAEELQAKVSTLQTDLQALEGEHEKVCGLLAEAELVLDDAQVKWRDIRIGIKQLNDYIRLADAEVARVERQMAVERSQLDGLESDLALLQNAKTCPTCGQEIRKADLKVHKDEILDKVTELRNRMLKPGVLKAAKQAAGDLLKQLHDAQKDEAEFKRKADNAEAETRIHSPKAASLAAEIEALKRAHTERESERNPYSEQLRKLKKEKATADAHLEELRRSHRIRARKMERTKFWIKGFKDVRLNIITDVLEELELATNAMLDAFGLVGWQVSYQVEKETKSGTIKRGLDALILSPQNERAVRWENWSGGEAHRLRLISALALSDVLLTRVGIEPGFEILDEPTRHLSGEGIRDQCEMLADRADELRRQVWFVDHRAVESARAGAALTIIKGDCGSVVDSWGKGTEIHLQNARIPGKKGRDSEKRGVSGANMPNGNGRNAP